jgi:hypothetical protein
MGERACGPSSVEAAYARVISGKLVSIGYTG